MIYTGIGARETPAHIQLLMTAIAKALDTKGYTLRSGGAKGADSAFEKGVSKITPEIYLPWKGFRKSTSLLYTPSPMAHTIAAKYHPRWNTLKSTVKLLMARNTHQILGQDLRTLSNFVVCWTADGKNSGGTGQALRLAVACKIPIYNLHNKTDIERLRQHVLNG